VSENRGILPDIDSLIEQGTSAATLEELTRKGYRRVKVLDAAKVRELVRKVFDEFLQQRLGQAREEEKRQLQESFERQRGELERRVQELIARHQEAVKRSDALQSQAREADRLRVELQEQQKKTEVQVTSLTGARDQIRQLQERAQREEARALELGRTLEEARSDYERRSGEAVVRIEASELRCRQGDERASVLKREADRVQEELREQLDEVNRQRAAAQERLQGELEGIRQELKGVGEARQVLSGELGEAREARDAWEGRFTRLRQQLIEVLSEVAREGELQEEAARLRSELEGVYSRLQVGREKLQTFRSRIAGIVESVS
jgi:chromosome segregation ATPase